MKNKYVTHGNETKIFLNTKNKVLETIVDTNDLDILLAFETTWYPLWNPRGKTYYVVGNTPYRNGNRKNIKLHRLLMGNPKGLVIDHINHDTLDNRKINLRAVTQRVNIHNPKTLMKTNTSGVRGVHWDKNANKWRARISVYKKTIDLGRYDSIKQAEEAYLVAKKIYHEI